jgi:hypothetical protein
MNFQLVTVVIDVLFMPDARVGCPRTTKLSPETTEPAEIAPGGFGMV